MDLRKPKVQNLDEYPVAVVLFTLRGCPACASMKTTIDRLSKTYGSCLPTLVLDVGVNPDLVAHFKLKSAPTLFVIRNGRRSGKMIVGAVESAKVEKLYASAARGLECSLP